MSGVPASGGRPASEHCHCSGSVLVRLACPTHSRIRKTIAIGIAIAVGRLGCCGTSDAHGEGHHRDHWHKSRVRGHVKRMFSHAGRLWGLERIVNQRLLHETVAGQLHVAFARSWPFPFDVHAVQQAPGFRLDH